MFKIVLSFFAVISFTQAQAEPTPIGCAIRTYDCLPMPDGSNKCSWGSDLGSLYSIDLKKTGSSPGYEIWQGKLDGTAHKYKYQISVYQRREPNKKVNYLTADFMLNGIKITGQGENTVETRFLIEAKNEGIGIHCSVDISPSP